MLVLSTSLTLFGPTNHITFHTGLFVAVRKYAELLNELPVDQNETGRTVASANGEVQSFYGVGVMQFTYQHSVRQMNGRVLSPKIPCLQGVLPKDVGGWRLFVCQPVK